jgi:hypothetical protein
LPDYVRAVTDEVMIGVSPLLVRLLETIKIRRGPFLWIEAFNDFDMRVVYDILSALRAV